MPATTKTKPPSRTRRDLVEQFAVGTPGSSPLKIDEDAGVIYRVKVLGRFSRNNHGLTEAEGSDYGPAMKGALPLYEGSKVKENHPPDRTKPAAERAVDATFGVLRNCVLENDESGEPAIWADLHYLKSHPLANRVVEDVQRGLGVYGLSHNAAAKRERFDRASKRLVIEEIALVRSVDLVDKPATNRNLWESETMTKKITLRSVLESRMTKFTKARQTWARHLLEDDMAAPMAAEADVPAEGGDEDDALWAGFQAAISKVLDSYKDGSLDAASAGKKIQEWIKAHDKLAGKDEPEEVVEEDPDKDAKKDAKDKQESAELATLRTEKKTRELCESMGLAPTALQLAAVAGLPADKQRRDLIESFKSQKTPAGFKTPKSVTPGTVTPKKGDKPRETQESETGVDADATMRILHGD